MPVIEGEGRRLRVIAGSFDGTRSPVATLSSTVCVHAELTAGARLALSGTEQEERALYVVSGAAALGGEPLALERLTVLKPGAQAVVTARFAAHFLLLGGAPIERKQMWSTVIANTAARIERAKTDWGDGRISSVFGETDRGSFPPSM